MMQTIWKKVKHISAITLAPLFTELNVQMSVLFLEMLLSTVG